MTTEIENLFARLRVLNPRCADFLKHGCTWPADYILIHELRRMIGAYETKAKLPDEARLRRVRVIRDYRMFDRREAPQYYPDAKRPT